MAPVNHHPGNHHEKVQRAVAPVMDAVKSLGEGFNKEKVHARVEEFITKCKLDAKATDQLRALPPQQQLMVISSYPANARKPSAVVASRIHMVKLGMPASAGWPGLAIAAGMRPAEGEGSPKREGRSRSPRREGGEVRSAAPDDGAPGALLTPPPPEVAQWLQRMEQEGMVKPGDLDEVAISNLANCSPDLQEQVMVYLDDMRIYFLNARTKSGFIVAACEKAKRGDLNWRGLGAPDPWRPWLQAVAVPRPCVELLPEQDWLDRAGLEPVKLHVDVSADKELGVANVSISAVLTHSVGSVKEMLAAVGVTIPINKMKLKEASKGFLRDDRSLAFYNLRDGSTLALSGRVRGGRRAFTAEKRLALEEHPAGKEEAPPAALWGAAPSWPPAQPPPPPAQPQPPAPLEVRAAGA